MRLQPHSRRSFLRGALVTGAAGLVVACGGSDRRARTSLSGPGASPTPTASPAPHRPLAGTITVSYPDELGKKPPYVEQAAAAVQQAYPSTTVRIDHQRVPASDYYAQLLPVLGTAEAPDVIHVGGERTGELADAGLIVPLDDYLKTWPDWQYFPPTVTAGLTYQGKIWAVPYGLDTRFLFYRRDVFEQAGLPAAWQPRNVSDILDTAARIKAQVRGVIPYALYAGPAGDAGTANHGFLPLLRAYGGDLQDREGYWIGNSPAIRKALAFYTRAFVTDRLAPAELLTTPRPWVTMRERLGDGRLAMLFEGGWVYGGWVSRDRAATEKNVGYLLHPTESAGPSFTIGGPGTCWFISARSQNKDLAWEFITTFNGRDTAGRLNAEDPHPVARVDAVRVPEYRGDRFLVDATESLRRAYFTPVDADYPKVVTAIQRTTALTATGEAGPEEAATRYAEDLRNLLGANRVVIQV